MEGMLKGRKAAREAVQGGEPDYEIDELLKTMDEEMRSAASALHFEKAAILRDQIGKLKKLREDAIATGGSTKIRRSEVQDAAEGRFKPKGRAGMPGVRANKRSKKSSNRDRG
jgi:hypothetical protein